ncbi:response regulator transcription factor [Butyrivibrio sp. AE2032]|uniref:response regulator transcription factor n=1 Tax=Butyrivibrio sp. AE2032 TaxID=1458463 RepID=UPI0005581BE7|nr:response regulator transcription factor [Butyrivibrio sp. AE2032]
MSRILIVEDDEDIGAVLQRELSKDGYEVIRAVTGTEGRVMLAQNPDLILMDLMLPGLTGEELLTHIPKETPVIAVSARSSIDDKVSLLTSGCVDYITKPFDIKELKARVVAALRTAEGKKKSNLIKCGEMQIDTDKHEVTIEGKELKLTRTEYAILKMLATGGGRVISKSELLDLIKTETPDCTESSVKVHVSNLRKKIKEVTDTEYVEAVWGIGFKLKGES